MLGVYSLNTMNVFNYFENRDYAENALKRYAESIGGQYDYDFSDDAYCITSTDGNGYKKYEWFKVIE